MDWDDEREDGMRGTEPPKNKTDGERERVEGPYRGGLQRPQKNDDNPGIVENK